MCWTERWEFAIRLFGCIWDVWKSCMNVVCWGNRYCVLWNSCFSIPVEAQHNGRTFGRYVCTLFFFLVFYNLVLQYVRMWIRRQRNKWEDRAHEELRSAEKSDHLTHSPILYCCVIYAFFVQAQCRHTNEHKVLALSIVLWRWHGESLRIIISSWGC